MVRLWKICVVLSVSLLVNPWIGAHGVGAGGADIEAEVRDAGKHDAEVAMQEAGMDLSEIDESELHTGPAIGDLEEGELPPVDEEEEGADSFSDDEDSEGDDHDEDGVGEDEEAAEDGDDDDDEEAEEEELFVDLNPDPDSADKGPDSIWTEEHLSAEQFASIHKKVDESGDGKISLDELIGFSQVARRAVIKQEVDEGFLQMDSNDDGKISLDELLENTVGGPQKPEDNQNMEPLTADEIADNARTKELETAKFKAADHNKDGFLDKDESIPVLYPEFNDGMLELIASSTMKTKDKNGNGELEHEEFFDSTHSEFNEFEEEKKQDALNFEKADFEKLDLDKNGKINVEELKQWESGRFHTEDAMKGLFEVADEDEDKLVTASELNKARPLLANHVAIPHLQEWVEHYEL